MADENKEMLGDMISAMHHRINNLPTDKVNRPFMKELLNRIVKRAQKNGADETLHLAAIRAEKAGNCFDTRDAMCCSDCGEPECGGGQVKMAMLNAIRNE